MTSPIKRDHKGVSGKPGKWVYITLWFWPSAGEIYMGHQLWNMKMIFKDIFEKYKKILQKNFPPKKFVFKNFFLPHNFHPNKLQCPKNWVKFSAKFGKFWNLTTLAFYVRSWWSFFCWNQHLLSSTVQLITPFPLLIPFHWRLARSLTNWTYYVQFSCKIGYLTKHDSYIQQWWNERRNKWVINKQEWRADN